MRQAKILLCLHYVTFFNLLVAGEAASTMDLSLDELIKKNKPEKKKGANNNNNSSKNKKKRSRNQDNSGGNGKRQKHHRRDNNSRDNNMRNNSSRNSNSKHNMNHKNRGSNTFKRGNSNNKGGGEHFKRKERFNFKPAWRGDHVALQLDGIDMVMINTQGKIVLTTAGDPSKRSLMALNSVLKQFKLSVQPSMSGQWTIYDTEVPEYRQPFFDGVFVLDAKRDPARMRSRWNTINKAYGRDAEAEAKKHLDKQLLQHQKQLEEDQKRLDAFMWVRPKDTPDEELYDAKRLQLPKHEQSGSIYFLRGLSERKGWDEPIFEREQNEEGLTGYSVKLSFLDETIAPSQWYESESEAMVATADEALEMVKIWHSANQSSNEGEDGEPESHAELGDVGSNAHVWRPGQ